MQTVAHIQNQATRGRVRQRRARGRLASQGACAALIISEGKLPSRDLSANATDIIKQALGINTPAIPWKKQLPTGTEAMESPRESARHNYDLPAPVLQEGSPLTLVESPEQCTAVMQKLDEVNPADQHALLQWLRAATRELALSKIGCRVVQKAFEVAGGPDRDIIIADLKDHIVELYESPWGNHVLSRAIELLPAAKNSFVISALRGRGVIVSKHRFGCRIMCRLIEHCPEEQIGGLLDEIVVEADSLARHTYGNFPLQSILEHASPARRSAALSQILPDFPTLAMHRTGSLIAQRSLDHGDSKSQSLALQTLLQAGDKNSLVDVACSRYGSYVIEQIAGLWCDQGLSLLRADIVQILASNLPQLQASDHAHRVIIAFQLAHPEPLSNA